jgi:hypothetical protein
VTVMLSRRDELDYELGVAVVGWKSCGHLACSRWFNDAMRILRRLVANGK